MMLMVTIFNTSDALLAKVMFNNKKQPLFSNNLSLEIEKKLIKVVFGVLLFMDQKHRP
jgi:hypothetical protein